MGGGIVGITKTPSAVSRWTLSHNLRSYSAAQTSAMFDIHHDDCLIHKESGKERQKQDNEAENAFFFFVFSFSEKLAIQLPL